MADLVGARARPFVAEAESGTLESTRDREALEALENELNSIPRFGLGVVSVVVALFAGLVLAFGVEEGGAGGALAGAIGLVVLVGAGWLGLLVVRAGRRVQSAYVAWCGASRFAPPAWSVYGRLLTGRGILRSALAAAGFIGAAFALSLVYLGLSPADPADLGDSQAMAAVLGAVASAAFLVATWCAIAGEVRPGRANAARLRRP